MKYAKSVAQFDLIVIGSGPGGQRAALAASKAGRRVVIVEDYPGVGGACVHYGTLPSKSFRESVYRWSLGSRGSLGQEIDHPVKKKVIFPDMKRLLRRRDWVVSAEAQVVFDQLKRNGITVMNGFGRMLGPNRVEVKTAKSTKEISGDKIVIAVGGGPVAPGHLNVDGKRVFDSNSILRLKEIPRSMVVLGGGIIGCEYASMFMMAGTKVTLVDKRHEILANVDREIVGALMDRFKSQGMDILLKSDAVKLDSRAKGVQVTYASGKRVTVDTVLVAMGRKGNTEGLGLENIGVTPNDRGTIPVNGFYQTACPNVYAVGDVVGAPALASTSMEQGRIATCHAFDLEPEEMSPLFPTGIYTIPEVSMVGPTEEDLIKQKADFVVGRARYKELARGQIVGDRWGLLKLLVCKKSLKLLGVHIVGDNAADLVHIGQAVMAFDGDVKYFIRSVFNYPTLAEGYKTAAYHAINQIRGVKRPKHS